MELILKENKLRITALWAFSEAFLGGMLHALKIPFTGLILSAVAVICMAALSLPTHRRGQIFKATILVLIVKAMLSPHTPITAYFAVFLQGVFGELIFLSGLTYRIAAFILAIFALMQSAFQKLIILTVLFGVDFWKAIDDFLNSITKDMGLLETTYSFYIVVIYLSLYFIAGIITGWFVVRLPKLLNTSSQEFALVKSAQLNFPFEETQRKARKRFSKPVYWILFSLLMLAVYHAYAEGDLFAIIQSKALKLFIRAILVMLLWYFFVAPILLNVFQKWLMKQKSKFAMEADQIIKLLPEIKSIILKAWVATATYKLFTRWNKFIGLTFLLLIKNPHEN